MMQKIKKLLKNPAKIIKAVLRHLRYQTPNGYNARGYWSDRHREHGFDLCGVGHHLLSSEENQKYYDIAKDTFLELCKKQNIGFENTKILDVGCGTGFYAQIFRDNGGEQYVGIDIADTLLDELTDMFPTFKFIQKDIGSEDLEGTFDLIIMIDVTQHITDSKKFSYAMQNVRAHLAENGIFIVTSWLNENVRKRYYEVSRPISAYEREFPDYTFSKPIPFRNKFIFSIKKNT